MSNPGFFLYTGDWIKDTRCLTATARGCWADALCFLNEHKGSVTWPVTAYANFWSMPTESATAILDELNLTEVANVEWQNDGKTMAKLSNRRMLRQAKEHEQVSDVRSDAGKKGASKRWQKWHPSESSSSSESSSNTQPHTSPSIMSGFYNFWDQYPRKIGRGEAEAEWKKLKPNQPLQVEILKALENHKQSFLWDKENGRFIPAPARWLLGRRWEDEIKKKDDNILDFDEIRRRAVERDEARHAREEARKNGKINI